MKALIYLGPGKTELQDIEEVRATPEEAVVRITASGICGSDVEGFMGKTGRRTEPMIMGHELAGVVEQPAEQGGGALKAGDKVVIFPKLYCGSCPECLEGKYNICAGADTLGVLSRNGGNTERIAIAEKYLIKVDPQLDDVTLSLTEPIAVANHAVRTMLALNLPTDAWVMIVGGGTIGMFILQVLKVHGYSRIIMADLSDYRLGLARQLGAVPVNPADPERSAVDAVRDVTGGAMVTCSFEAVGMGRTAELCLDVLKMGGYSVWVGNAQKMIQVDMQAIVTRERRILGSYLYTWEDFQESLDHIAKGAIDRSIVSAVIPLSEAAAYTHRLAENNKDGRLIKVVIDPTLP